MFNTTYICLLQWFLIDISDKFNFIAYADDTTLTSPLVTFTRGVNCNIDIISSEMNKEIKKITDWLVVKKIPKMHLKLNLWFFIIIKRSLLIKMSRN